MRCQFNPQYIAKNLVYRYRGLQTAHIFDLKDISFTFQGLQNKSISFFFALQHYVPKRISLSCHNSWNIDPQTDYSHLDEVSSGTDNFIYIFFFFFVNDEDRHMSVLVDLIFRPNCTLKAIAFPA